jgi:hypothetical protein
MTAHEQVAAIPTDKLVSALSFYETDVMQGKYDLDVVAPLIKAELLRRELRRDPS